VESLTTSHMNVNTKQKKRICQFPCCPRRVKSQGLCQRHGARPRRCKLAGCNKQAQGNFDGMCSKCVIASRGS
jgi:hypothetical protein